MQVKARCASCQPVCPMLPVLPLAGLHALRWTHAAGLPPPPSTLCPWSAELVPDWSSSTVTRILQRVCRDTCARSGRLERPAIEEAWLAHAKSREKGRRPSLAGPPPACFSRACRPRGLPTGKRVM